MTMTPPPSSFCTHLIIIYHSQAAILDLIRHKDAINDRKLLVRVFSGYNYYVLSDDATPIA